MLNHYKQRVGLKEGSAKHTPVDYLTTTFTSIYTTEHPEGRHHIFKREDTLDSNTLGFKL